MRFLQKSAPKGTNISDTQSTIDMRPRQIWKPRFPNVKIGEKRIELPERAKVTRRVTFSILICQFFSKEINYLCAIFSTF